jgi:hypothetical protein
MLQSAEKVACACKLYQKLFHHAVQNALQLQSGEEQAAVLAAAEHPRSQCTVSRSRSRSDMGLFDLQQHFPDFLCSSIFAPQPAELFAFSTYISRTELAVTVGGTPITEGSLLKLAVLIASAIATSVAQLTR